MVEFTPQSRSGQPAEVDVEVLRRLIRSKLRGGSLPWDSIPRVWGGKGANEICSACGEKIPPEAPQPRLTVVAISFRMNSNARRPAAVIL